MYKLHCSAGVISQLLILLPAFAGSSDFLKIL